ncbi:roadblock/LC7 domain-containing protein [Kitasatospora sp. NPDC101176]|uniref:roadblock/LC7 domain-containing protein n=1 Tax=Kitasatospora sp. NPDC101176 TaxID=3364099 RepID=UPI003801BA7A
MTDPSTAGTDLDWLIVQFADENPEVLGAAVVSSDGVLLACGGDAAAEGDTRLAAITCGVASLADGCAQVVEGGRADRTLVDLGGGCLLVSALTHGALLAVLATDDCDLALLGYQSARLARRAGAALAPAPRTTGAGAHQATGPLAR